MTHHATDTYTTHSNCGGTILSGGSGDKEHIYCDRCRAYIYDVEAWGVPTGTDAAANRAAWDAGAESSPAASEAEPDTDYICAVCHDCTDLTSAERAMAIAGTLLDDEGLYYCAGCWADVYGARS